MTSQQNSSSTSIDPSLIDNMATSMNDQKHTTPTTTTLGMDGQENMTTSMDDQKHMASPTMDGQKSTTKASGSESMVCQPCTIYEKDIQNLLYYCYHTWCMAIFIIILTIISTLVLGSIIGDVNRLKFDANTIRTKLCLWSKVPQEETP